MGATNPVDIVGAGRERGGTVLYSSVRSPILDVRSPGSTVSNLRVEVEIRPGDAETGVALRGEGVVADGITVAGDPFLSTATGVFMEAGAILRNSSVQMANSVAIRARPGTLIEDVSATGFDLVRAFGAGPPVVVRRLRSSGPSRHGIYADRAAVDVSDSLIRLADVNSIGLLSSSFTGAGAVITANHVTVIGAGGPLGTGTGALAGADGAPAAMEVRDSVFRGLRNDLEVFSNSPSPARIVVGHSNFNPFKVEDTSSGDAEVIAGDGNLFADPGFVDAAALDFRLRPESPLVDRGFAGEGSPTDLDGLPRPTDGNGDGTAVRDIGAFEYQRPPAQAPAPGPPPATGDGSAPLVRILSKRLKLDRRGRVAVMLRGPENETSASSGSLALRGARGRLALGRKSFSLRPSARTVVKVKLSGKKARRVRKLKKMRVALAVSARDGAGNARTLRERVTLRALPCSRRRACR